MRILSGHIICPTEGQEAPISYTKHVGMTKSNKHVGAICWRIVALCLRHFQSKSINTPPILEDFQAQKSSLPLSLATHKRSGVRHKWDQSFTQNRCLHEQAVKDIETGEGNLQVVNLQCYQGCKAAKKDQRDQGHSFSCLSGIQLSIMPSHLATKFHTKRGGFSRLCEA